MKKLFITALAVLALAFTGCGFSRTIEEQAAFDAKYAKILNEHKMSEGNSETYVGCANEKYTRRTTKKNSFISLETVGHSDGYEIRRDNYTGVLYLISTYNTTPIMEADGTCLTWDEWTKQIDNKGE